MTSPLAEFNLRISLFSTTVKKVIFCVGNSYIHRFAHRLSLIAPILWMPGKQLFKIYFRSQLEMRNLWENQLLLLSILGFSIHWHENSDAQTTKDTFIHFEGIIFIRKSHFNMLVIKCAEVRLTASISLWLFTLAIWCCIGRLESRVRDMLEGLVDTDSRHARVLWLEVRLQWRHQSTVIYGIRSLILF